MEIKRKKITNEEIYASEMKFAEEIAAFCAEKKNMFAEIGYELDLDFGQKENEAQSRFRTFSMDEGKDYEAGYISRALVTVKRLKTEEELEEDRRLMEANKEMIGLAQDEDEIEQLENDETLRISDAERKRSVAFTEIMLVRTYKSFWTEWVSLGNSTSDLERDLAEFYDVLLKRKEECAE